MTRAAAFTAELVRTTSSGLSGLVAARLFEQIEGADQRYGDGGFDSWRRAMAARLEALASALEANDVEIFTDDMLWFRGVTTSREIDPADVTLALKCLRETLVAQLPESTSDALESYFVAAESALSSGDVKVAGLDAGSDAAELFDLALTGDLSSARNFLVDGLQSGRFTLIEAIIDVLLPAAKEAGRRWHLGELGVATEHVVTSTLRSSLHSLTTVLPRPKANGKAAFVAAVPGDAHDTGLIALALLLEQDGWRVALAGADTPADEIDATAEGYECDLIVLSATLVAQRHALVRFLDSRDGGRPVLVGGAAIRGEDDARAMGADAYSANLAGALQQARELVGLD